MDQLAWKLNKIKSLENEVKELQPVLHALFQEMPQVKSIGHTQGNREDGADFVLVIADDLLGQDEYVGVVVKSTVIRQNSDDVHRQIRECTLKARPIEGGKKEIYLTEVWVITSQEITRNMQDFLHAEYKTTKLKFIDAELLVKLIDKYFPKYWDFANATVGKFITKQKHLIESHQNLNRLLPIELGRVARDNEIQRESNDSKRKFSFNKNKPTTLREEIKKRKFIFIEGRMGSGKSDLLLSTALSLCDIGHAGDHTFVPYFTTYKELVKNAFFSKPDFIQAIHDELGDPSKKVVIFIDGLDESQAENSEKVATLSALAGLINAREDTSLVVASRPIDEESLADTLAKSFDKYSVCPLTYGVVVSFVQQICKNAEVSNRLREDLQKSPLLRALPRTPLSAILLGKLLKENINELPSTLPELYSKYVELVLGRWDLKKGQGSEKEYETLQRLTSMLAKYCLDHDLDEVGVREVKSMFEAYLNERRTGQRIDPMMESFLSKTELVSLDTERGIVRFRHKTFAEYFYAHALLMEKGKNAPVNFPFHQNWHAIEYFYLGLVRDAPERIDRLSAYTPLNAAEEFIKFSQFGSFLMAAYQTPYEHIENALYIAFRDAALHYSRIVKGRTKEWLNHLPELQILSLFTYLVRSSYGYDFFRPALVAARLEAELDNGLTEDEKVVAIFLVDAVLASLHDPSAFTALLDRKEAHMSWAIRLGIGFAAKDASFMNDAVRRMEKKFKKTLSNNRELHRYIEVLQSTPLTERKDLEGPQSSIH